MESTTLAWEGATAAKKESKSPDHLAGALFLSVRNCRKRRQNLIWLEMDICVSDLRLPSSLRVKDVSRCTVRTTPGATTLPMRQP